MFLDIIPVLIVVYQALASPVLHDFEKEFLEAIYNDVQRVENHTIPENYIFSCSACYDEVGCFDGCRGVFWYLRTLPQSPEKVSTQFTLYSRQTGADGVGFTYTDVTPVSKLLDGPKNLHILVHGFGSSAAESWVVQLRESILKDDDARVIAVDWSRGCALPNYIQAVANTQLVGRQIAVVLHKLMEISPDNVSPGTTHYIGHSLGAQMAKFFSEYFRNLSGNLLIGRITALDPAAPLFEVQNVCLNSSAANFVDGIHTSAGDNILRGKLGVRKQVGHLDLYINGGTNQPGCNFFDLMCAHQRSHDYYVEAAQLDSDCAFPSYACVGGMKEYRAGKCRKVPGDYNGISLDRSVVMPGRGIQFVDTRSHSPFCE